MDKIKLKIAGCSECVSSTVTHEIKINVLSFFRYLFQCCVMCFRITVLFIYFQNLGCNHTTANAENTNTIYAYMDTKGRMCRHLHSTNKTKKMHLINIMSVHGIKWRRVGDTRINRTSILSKDRNRFSSVYTWSALKSWNQQHQGWDCSVVL